MEFDGCVNKSEDDVIWIDEESAGPENAHFSNYKFNERGFKTRRRYGTDQSQNPRSHSFWGRGYGPAGPPNKQSSPRENDNETFLIQCGVMKPALRGLPKVLLRLMEPEYCGVCAHGFVHLDEARLHYISKNHFKNQKKWLTQQAKVGSKRPIEIPMRARELYCELCDIHITSTSHAESHYGGKQHRAIVEGRKIPKNPFLLQKNMHARVEQLIRREKKSLKFTKKPAASEVTTTVSTPITPELYCDICKSAVTCSDQMTMHLNGKKHLAKEKWHIFNMMKGETTTTTPKPAEPADTSATAKAKPAEPADTSATAKAKPAEPADTSATAKDADVADSQGADGWEKWETNNHEDEYDWGHGSGTWDDDPQ